MSEDGADRAGNKLALAALIFASCAGAAIVLWVIRWW